MQIKGLVLYVFLCHKIQFCTEVSASLPTCERHSKNKDSTSSDENTLSMIKTIRKTFLAPELPSVSINCYCPPLYRGWTFLSKTEPMDNTNGTGTTTASGESNYYYRCDKVCMILRHLQK